MRCSIVLLHRRRGSQNGTAGSGGEFMCVMLEGKTALVSGAGRGIGRAIANKLATSGAQVMVNDLDEAALKDTVCGLRKAGYQAECLPGDLTDPSFPDKLI